MNISKGCSVLRERYNLVSDSVESDDAFSSWIGQGVYDSEYLIKIWPYSDSKPDDFNRALWDAELRTMYRVGSSPGAEDTVLVIRDAGVDKEHNCFVMVLEAVGSNGYTPLTECLANRVTYEWLVNKDLRGRVELWHGLQRIAEGLQLLHSQNVLHRNVEADGIYLNVHLGPDSFRLGGFEWSIRLGQPATGSPNLGWSTAPEHLTSEFAGFSHDTDWYGFGVLASRCLLNIEAFNTLELKERHSKILGAIVKSTGKQLSEIEKSFLLRLLDPSTANRLTRGSEVLLHIKEIVSVLERGSGAGVDDRSLVLVINQHNCQQVIEKAFTLGFIPNADKPHDDFNPHDLIHVTSLTSFIQQDLSASRLYATPGHNFYILTGRNMTLTLLAYSPPNTNLASRSPSWEYAYCNSTGELRVNSGGTSCRELPKNSVIVRTVKQIRYDTKLRQSAVSWERYLPVIERSAELRASLSKFHEFIRCTNQLELLIRDAEIFGYEIVKEESDASKQLIHIREIQRPRPPAPWCEIEGGLQEFLQREIDNGKLDSRHVILSTEDEDGLTLSRDVDAYDYWAVRNTNSDDGHIILERSILTSNLRLPPKKGHIRTKGMFGQVSLIQRRKRAIDRLGKHAYLLRSLSAPGQVYMDTGNSPLNIPLSSAVVDEAKQAVIQDILRVRPIYALQGPPGTGKTTLVSHLIPQILADDPVAQILITAPTHGAVDVLRSKANSEFSQDEAPPLSVRLGRDEDSESIHEGSVKAVSIGVLQKSIEALQSENHSQIQAEWFGKAVSLFDTLSNKQLSNDAGDFCELVRRGASITYCTTSAGDLEELAESSQTFDWAILEEAGKAHAFDLALPLQSGHRWLLIGDPNQLPPYRYDEYLKGLEKLDLAVEWLFKLPATSQRLVDIDWLRTWQEQESSQQEDFVRFAKEWLNTFKKVLTSCTTATDGTDKRTIDESNGAMAGLLSGQYRMHPTIGNLISAAYYKSELINRTEIDKVPIPEVVHPFIGPKGIHGKSIVWIDTPWSAREREFEEQGPRNKLPRFRNYKEAKVIKAFLNSLEVEQQPNSPLSLAVLSPYNQQVSLIRNELKDVILPSFLTLKNNLSSSVAVDVDVERSLAHSVDSFQGNEADIIIVSLVRNNTLPAGAASAIGFLKDAPRLNVLLSRAQRLLVLTGSWDFFWHQFKHVPIEDNRQELWHWRKVVTLLDGWFKDGSAVKISAESFGDLS